ncbi:MAG: 5-bromo-4-chloroindolyl phosphate hydrolysis family protein [Terrisporobacter sp.]|jgi:5-bromo-4-chloroindolyl phosphate hydrolysis protein|uniref:5-bromo-4-chloroindolyl phosphate hydrolysis family protein n=1 Tax=Terrisporobacter sp. TaxID=1965305 RepID=UPI002F952A15
MSKREFYNLEDEITAKVKDALKAIDMVNIKRDFNYKAEDTINQFKSKFTDYAHLDRKTKNNVSMYINRKPPGRISGIVCIVLGSVGISLYGLSLLSFTVVNIISGGIIGSSVFVLLLLLFVISIVVLFKGLNLKRRVDRFKRYVTIMDRRTYITIKDLSKLTKQKERFLVKDLEKMIDMGMFYQGHIDEEKAHFMITDEVYNDYLNLKKQEIEDKKKEQRLEEEIKNLSDKDVQSTLKVGRDYIKEIKSVKNELYREEISMKLDKLSNVSEEILKQIEKNPKKVEEVNKFINHYLPITLKLINSYEELNAQSLQGENIQKAKIEIEESIDLINKAFENLLDDLFEDIRLDISTDISVLKTLFKQEGLGEEDFKNKK